jgi:hypothetical protein
MLAHRRFREYVLFMQRKTAPEKPLRVEVWLATRDMRKIAAALLTFPKDERAQSVTAAEYNACSRSRRYGSLEFHSLVDGVAVAYTTEAWLEDRSHRFIFPDETEPTYHRDAFNVDCQAIGSRPINLDGIQEITTHTGAIDQIRFIAAPILNLADVGWQGLETHRTPSTQC